MKSANKASFVYHYLLAAFFPKKCLVCKEEGAFLCENHTTLPPSPPLPPLTEWKYVDDLWVRTAFDHKAVRQLVHHLKFYQKKELSELIAQKIKQDLPPKFKKVDLLVPMPLHWTRKLARGFNQTELIVDQMSLNIPSFKGLKRTKKTPQQIGLSKSERQKNIQSAFTLKKAIKAETVLIIDDVMTTGSTLEEAAKTLKSAGVKKVYAIAFAHGT